MKSKLPSRWRAFFNLQWAAVSSRRVRVSGWALTTVLVAGVIAWTVWRVPAASVSQNPEVRTASAHTMEALLKNSAAPQNLDDIQHAAASLFVILNPELAYRERRQDPAFQQAESAAVTSFLNPGATHAKRMADPVYRRKYHAAMSLFKSEARPTAPLIVPSATDARQIRDLRNDPVWRERREKAVRALLPPGQP